MPRWLLVAKALVSYVPGQDQSNSLPAGPRNDLRSISKVGGCTEPEMVGWQTRRLALLLPPKRPRHHGAKYQDRAPGRGVGAVILSSVGRSIRLPQSAE